MNTRTLDTTTGAILNVDIAHRMAPRDFRRLVAELGKEENASGPLRLVIQVHDLADDAIQWGDSAANHSTLSVVDRIAIIGQKKWEKAMAAFCQPFPVAKVRYFLPGQSDLARKWIREPPLRPVEPAPE